MKPNIMVAGVLIFGILVSFVTPHLLNMQANNVYEADNPSSLATTTETVNSASEVVSLASNFDLAVATPMVEETKVEEEVKEEEVKEETTQVVSDPVVYDGLTMEQLVAKLNKSLNSTLKNTGNLFATYSLEYGIDPYLAVAIALHETGCKWSCSAAVTKSNNVGGMYSGGSLISFASLDEGIKAFIKNIKVQYYDKGLNTPELMNKKYASSTTWASKVTMYMNDIKKS